MDLSNLSTNLPSEHPINDDTMQTINESLNDEFKSAAKSVAALYRLSNTKSNLLKQIGYKACVDELLDFLQDDSKTVLDIKQWLKGKKHDLEGTTEPDVQNIQVQTRNPTEQNNLTIPGQPKNSSNIERLPESFEFNISHPSPHRFPPSMIAPSLRRVTNKPCLTASTNTPTSSGSNRTPLASTIATSSSTMSESDLESEHEEETPLAQYKRTRSWENHDQKRQRKEELCIHKVVRNQ
ncbi:BA75_03444T0 [Komagataella pastoris]|uniref:BA75_03444T0 n=1 Tax=Komagataella pastoris TaxID=4922 RepID=A0A1B2JF48_PICPA|nr:BA75_03444T0 [Komagataella pastoris]